jgi:uncharacterized OB-fold protein
MTDLIETDYATCPECGAVTFPVHQLSPCGHSAPPELHPLTEEGEVFSWTRTYGEHGPTVLAMADFLGGAIRVTAPVLDAAEVQIGDRLLVRGASDLPFVLVTPPRSSGGRGT